ncbi:hypothetical protein OK016_29400 [Vibrio chagasii]|nr:hypothetical protein [Vibrio chagasii]
MATTWMKWQSDQRSWPACGTRRNRDCAPVDAVRNPYGGIDYASGLLSNTKTTS